MNTNKTANLKKERFSSRKKSFFFFIFIQKDEHPWTFSSFCFSFKERGKIGKKKQQCTTLPRSGNEKSIKILIRLSFLWPPFSHFPPLPSYSIYYSVYCSGKPFKKKSYYSNYEQLFKTSVVKAKEKEIVNIFVNIKFFFFFSPSHIDYCSSQKLLWRINSIAINNCIVEEEKNSFTRNVIVWNVFFFSLLFTALLLYSSVSRFSYKFFTFLAMIRK